MKKIFICLANSKKYGERCIAGIEITDFDGTKYSIVKEGSHPKWLRPVSRKDHGEVSANLAGKLNLLDIVEFEMLAECPHGYQSENVFFDEQSLRVVGKVDWISTNVAQFEHSTEALLFGNKGKAVHIDMIDQIDHSLVLIRPANLSISEVTYPNGKHQLRASFIYNGREYDLPITDVDFIDKYTKHPDKFTKFSEHFLTISLGVEHEEFHSKLVAAVFNF